MSLTVVASAKGGVGKSTFCAEMGRILASSGKRVLLVDMDIGVRSLDIMFGVADKVVYNWGDVLKNNCSLKKPLIGVMPNLKILPAPIDFEEDFNAENLKELFAEYSADFDYVFLDAPAGLEGGFRLAAECADKCIIVTNPDPVSIRAASAASQKVRLFGIDDVRLVINKFNKRKDISLNIDNIIDVSCARLLGIIPYDKNTSFIVASDDSSTGPKFRKAYKRIAERLEGADIPLSV